MGIAVTCLFLLTFLYSSVAANDVCKAYDLHELLVVLATQGAKINEMSSRFETLEKAVDTLKKGKYNWYDAVNKLSWRVLRNSCSREKLEKKLEQQGNTSRKRCDVGWTMYGASCYIFPDDEALKFSKAQDYCTELNANLVHVDDEAENNFIKCHLLYSGDTSYWIGMKRDATDGKWKWADTKDVLTYSEWAPGQPDDHGDNEHCATFWIGSGYSWNDDSCDRTYIRPICEKMAGERDG